MDFFYRQHWDEAHRGWVSTLTEAGLGYYFYKRKSDEGELAENIDIIIDYDLAAGPDFSARARAEIEEKLTNSPANKRVSWVIHRDGHSVSLIREGNRFLLLDSYNAHGANDADHLPLLKIIRNLFPKAEIYTLRDKMQNDYYNCRIFALENLIEIERYCRMHNCGLNAVIGGAARIYFEDLEPVKDGAYEELSVRAIGTPVAIIPHIQSVRQIRAISEEYELLRLQREVNLTYLEYLRQNIDIVDGREINHLIDNRARETRERVSFFERIVGARFGDDLDSVMQKSFVDKLKINSIIRRIGER